MKAGLSVPLEAMKTTAAIHWEAARLWAKGVAYLGREGAPDDPTTISRRAPSVDNAETEASGFRR